MSQQKFDQARYWLERHQKLEGDPRSVGNLSATLEQNHAGEVELKALVRTAATRAGGHSALDLGCGYGRVADAVMQTGMSYTGVDVSPVALAQARLDNPSAKFVQADLATWEPTFTCDLVLILYVFVHFVDDDAWARFARASMRAVAPGGTWLIADNFPNEREAKVAHVVTRPLSDYDPFLAEAGLAWDVLAMQALRDEHPQAGQARHFRFARRTT